MIDKILTFLGSAIAIWRRDFERRCATVALVALFGSAGLGFGAFAAYLRLSASLGAALAALILCASCAAIAVAILGASAWRRRIDRSGRAGMPRSPASPQSLASLIEGLLDPSDLRDQKSLLAAMRFGQELSALDLVALSLLGGFIVARKLGK